MFRRVFITKDNKEKLKLKAQKQTLKGIRQLEKEYEVHSYYNLPDIMISKEYLERRFGTIENASYHLSDRLEESPITSEERDLLDDVDYHVEPVCIDDIKYTFHGKYVGHLGVSFTKAERMYSIIQLEKQNPDYYKKLKDYDFVEQDNDPIKIFFKEDEDGNTYGTIFEGNNRLLKMKCDMASELAHTTNKEEIEKIKKKYTIFVHAKDVRDIQKRR